jgi:transposase
MWDNARASLGVAALLRLAECLIGVYSCGEGSSSERRRAPATSAFQLLRLGWYRPVHAKSVSAQEVRSLLTARKLIQAKLLDVECGIRGVLRGFGLKVGAISRGRFELRIRELVDGNAILGTLVDAMLAARTALESEFKRLHRALLGIVRDDRVCRLLMSVPGVGAIVAITFRSGVDDPSRFKHSRDVGPHFGLTPRKYQSGEIDVTGAITKVGDRMVRTAFYEAASVMLTRTVRFSSLKAWGMAVAKRRGTKKARVALARKLGVILHRMWIDGTTFRWSNQETAIA